MTWEGAGAGGEYDAGAYPPRSVRTSRAGWGAIGCAGAVFAVMVAAFAAWFIHLQAVAARAPLAAGAAQQAIMAGTGQEGDVAGSAVTGSAAKNVTAASSSPLDRVDHSWAAKAAAATGIPDRAFLAYASADLTIDAEQPACGLGWNTLSAIATVESANGTYNGTTLLANGYTSKPIIGVALDGGTFGGGTVAAIPATGGGWAHAVGPFQFLPFTWAKWGADGNGDGVASPDQIDDAALAAARYLCASGPVSSVAGWRAAVFSYNHSNAYVNEVADIANRYAADVSGLS
jgi:membrane-bound lytic murein transglycosylase B